MSNCFFQILFLASQNTLDIYIVLNYTVPASEDLNSRAEFNRYKDELESKVGTHSLMVIPHYMYE